MEKTKEELLAELYHQLSLLNERTLDKFIFFMEEFLKKGIEYESFKEVDNAYNEHLIKHNVDYYKYSIKSQILNPYV